MFDYGGPKRKTNQLKVSDAHYRSLFEDLTGTSI